MSQGSRLHGKRILITGATSGVGLAVNPSLQAGSLLNIDLLDKNDRMMRTILARSAKAERASS